MNFHQLEIDWEYLLERIERLMDLAEGALEERFETVTLENEMFEQVMAFRWQHMGSHGMLLPVLHPDLPESGELYGLDPLLERLRHNTAQFVAGHPCNDVLLWGERGCGKSTAVRSLLEPFAPAGLRLIEVPREGLFHLPEIADTLRELPWRFLLFCDDLAFDESEGAFRGLKALLEGSIEKRPDNLLIYATSNRRHLMPERMSDNTGDSEIHPEEAIAEKLSLSDRFGITIAFYPHDPERFLGIVSHLARRRGLRVTRHLREKALFWARQRGILNGRVARQFLDDYQGRKALSAKS
ncbi:MAG: ATPase [Desulfuromonas sp.]|nr:MAG: ATPase [Desulfuromonas sp.]